MHLKIIIGLWKRKTNENQDKPKKQLKNRKQRNQRKTHKKVGAIGGVLGHTPTRTTQLVAHVHMHDYLLHRAANRRS